eukprot:TRINITY_DN2_c0_g1_i2.p1 TRINITY_DN2_c0_g1~~TRINITY_DN2_c0_g1_i2.p1  ORF type:complete len:78 (+),score=20.81 TRINITY_DN2_c0_g1_i2:95-328(+)
MHHVIDEPMHHVIDEQTYGEEKHSDMDHFIDEPMHYVDEPTYGEESIPTWIMSLMNQCIMLMNQPMERKAFRHGLCD